MTPEPPRGGSLHQSVLLQETLDLLAPERGSTVVDCTVGMGGHSRALLEAVGPAGRVVGIDRDRESLDLAQDELRDFGDRFLPIHADFRELPGVLRDLGILSVDTVLADFGFSSYQLDSPE